VRKLYLIPVWLYVLLGCCAYPALAAPKPIVKYLNVPVAMRDWYPDGTGEIRGVATYGRFRRFQVKTEETVK